MAMLAKSSAGSVIGLSAACANAPDGSTVAARSAMPSKMRRTPFKASAHERGHARSTDTLPPGSTAACGRLLLLRAEAADRVRAGVVGDRPGSRGLLGVRAIEIAAGRSGE